MGTHIYIYTYIYITVYDLTAPDGCVAEVEIKKKKTVGLPSGRQAIQAADEDEGDGTLRQSIGHLEEPNRIEGHPNWSACNEEDRLRGCGAGLERFRDFWDFNWLPWWMVGDSSRVDSIDCGFLLEICLFNLHPLIFVKNGWSLDGGSRSVLPKHAIVQAGHAKVNDLTSSSLNVLSLIVIFPKTLPIKFLLLFVECPWNWFHK